MSPLGDRIKGWLRPGATATPLRGEQAVRTLMHGNWTYFPSIVWRRSLVAERGLRPFEVVQDLALLVDLLVDGATLVVDSEVTFDYRRHAGSDSSVKALSGERFAEEAGYYQQISRELSQRGWTPRRDGRPDPLDLAAARADAAPPGTLSARRRLDARPPRVRRLALTRARPRGDAGRCAHSRRSGSAASTAPPATVSAASSTGGRVAQAGPVRARRSGRPRAPGRAPPTRPAQR